MKTTILAIICLSLVACAAPNSPEGIEARYGARCKALGFTPDTDAYRQCLLSERNRAIGAFGLITR